MKKHIFNKRQQGKHVSFGKALIEKEFLFNLDFSKNYSNLNQNEIQRAYLGSNSFSLFTACAFYSNYGTIEKFPVTIKTEASDKPRITSAAFVDFLMKYLRSQLDK